MLYLKATEIDIQDRFDAIRKQESTVYRCEDYLSPEFQSRQAREFATNNRNPNIFASGMSSTSSSSSSSRSGINELWREKICEWSYQVIDHFDFNREIVSISLDYLDRYLSTRPVNRKIFQLAAMTTLYLAIKLYESSSLKMSSFIELSRGYFSTEHIIAMEGAILRALDWHVHPPTAFTAVKYFMILLPNSNSSSNSTHNIYNEVRELSRFMTELSVCDYFFVQKKPTSIGLAALLTALELIGKGNLTQESIDTFLSNVVNVAGCDYNSSQVLECKARLKETYIQGGFYEQHQAEIKERIGNGGTSPVCVTSVPESQSDP
mmetsp:Transcript_4162/g.4724  ORF Transcript_4162/g.4724 Transcript_4162/m.4724 type:complete len:321 (-) Transcript_4162:1343-2305(-)